MRHKVFGRKLGRDINSRKALLRNLSSSILLSGHVVTTEAKAKFVRGYLEKLITNTQKNSLVNYRDAGSVLSGNALQKLVNEIGPGMVGRNGGYTRITKLNRRRGDAAMMARLEIVEWDKSKAKIDRKSKISTFSSLGPQSGGRGPHGTVSPERSEGSKSAVKKPAVKKANENE